MTQESTPILPAYQPAEIKQESLVTGDTFHLAITTDIAPGQTLYTVREDTFFLFKRTNAVNDSNQIVTCNLYVDSVIAFTRAVAANSTEDIFSFMTAPPGAVISVTGDGLVIYGWGIAAQGGTTWFL